MDAKAPNGLAATEELHYLSLTAISELIRTGIVSPVEVTMYSPPPSQKWPR